MTGIDWEEIWKIHSPYYKDGKFELELKNGKKILFLPGPAFGDGSHPTTNLVLEELQDLVAGKVVVDLGAGSGVLSLAASKYGAKEVYALEIDPLATKSMEQNIALNKISNIKVNKRPQDFDILLLNMISSEQEIALKSHPYLLQENKTCVISGILKNEIESTKKRLKLKDIITISYSTDWACLVVCKSN